MRPFDLEVGPWRWGGREADDGKHRRDGTARSVLCRDPVLRWYHVQDGGVRGHPGARRQEGTGVGRAVLTGNRLIIVPRGLAAEHEVMRSRIRLRLVRPGVFVSVATGARRLVCGRPGRYDSTEADHDHDERGEAAPCAGQVGEFHGHH